MNTNNPIKWRNGDTDYIAYFYEPGFAQRYRSNKSSVPGDANSRPSSTYDFSSDLTGKTGFYHGPTVEQIIASGYLAIPKSDPVEAIISDKKHTSWPILFGPGFAVRLSGLDAIEDLFKVSCHRAYAGVCLLEVRSMNPGCNHGGD